MLARGLWAAITASWAAMEFVAIKVKGGADPSWPPYTHFLREVRGGREDPQFWALVGVWAWLGWHIFVKDERHGS